MSNDGHYGSWDYDAFFHRGSDGHEERSQHDSQRGNQRYDHEERFMFDSYDHRGGYDTRSHHDSRGGDRGYNRSSGYDDHSRRGGDYGFGSREFEGSRGGYGYDNRGDYERSSNRDYGNRGSYRPPGGYDRGQGGYDDRGAHDYRADDRGAHGFRDERGRDDRGAHDYRADDRGAHGFRDERGRDDRGSHGYRDERGYNDRSREYSIDDLVAGYVDSSRAGYSERDRGYGHRGREDRGYRHENRQERQTHDRRDARGEDRGYGRRDDHRRGDHGRGGGRGYGAGRDGGRGGRRGGRGGAPAATGPGSGTITGSGYENIGNPVTDPQLLNEWTGTAGVRNVNSDDADLQQSVFICRRPNVGRGGKTIDIRVNYFSVSLHSAPVEIFKYHVSVEKEIDGELNDTGQAQRLPRSLVRKVMDAGLRQYKSDFGGACVVHDGMSAIYVPSRLYWDFKTLSNINPDDPQSMPAHPTGSHRRTFSMTIKLVEAISTRSLVDYYNNPDVNIMPVLQALNVIACHLGAQRLTNVGRSFFSMQSPTPLGGGKELCWGYHLSIRIGDSKLLMNVDQKATVFYTPGELTEIVLPMVDPRSVNDTRGLSDHDKRKLESVLNHLEVRPIHRKGWKRAIYGISAQPAYQTMVNIRDEDMSVADYFLKNYNVTLRYPYLPLVNVGRREAGKETWLPIELCRVAPAQRSTNVTDVDTAEILTKTGQPPRARQANTMKQVLQAGFENDPYQAAFGMTVDQNFVKIQARVMDPPEVQFANVSVRPPRGQWDLQRFVDGVTLRNWGIVVAANVTERDASKFVGVLVSIAGKSGLMIDGRPHMTHRDQFRGAPVKELMTMCLKELGARNKGPAQLIMVVMEERSDEEFREINYTSDTVLGILNQCILAENLRDAKPSICRNLSLQINSRLGGKNSILRDPLPLISTAPTIVIGADVDHPRPGVGSRPSIAAVVASMDCYSAKYIARVAAQTAANDIHHLPHILRDLFLAFFKNTNRKPEHVIYYRNGVSEGRFHDILEAEMRSLRVAFKMISTDYNPPVTFIVVNRRHHTRAAFFENDSNMAPGTVIDTGIVDSHRFDFFLYGHHGPLGTSVPCHYTVLHDENKMSAEDIQRLTYFLCYTCARCAKSVSCAVPVYYAQVVAERARLYLNESSDTSVAGDSFNSGFDFTDLHENLKDSMYFI